MTRLYDANVVEVGPRQMDRDFTFADPIHQDRQLRACLLSSTLDVAHAASRLETKSVGKPLLGPAFLRSESGPRVHL